jgi:hypothetical protein
VKPTKPSGYNASEKKKALHVVDEKEGLHWADWRSKTDSEWSDSMRVIQSFCQGSPGHGQYGERMVLPQGKIRCTQRMTWKAIKRFHQKERQAKASNSKGQS